MKTKSIFYICPLLLALCAAKVTAQNTETVTKIKEYGIGMQGFGNFSLQYRCGTERHLYRIAGNVGASSSFGNATENSTDGNSNPIGNPIKEKRANPFNFNCGISISNFKIKPVTEKLGFLCGTIGMVNYNIMQSTVTRTTTDNTNKSSTEVTTTESNQYLFPSIGLVLGGVYKISPIFYLYAEVNPMIYYSYNMGYINTNSITTNNGVVSATYSKKPYTNWGVGISNFTNTTALITFAYRVAK